jgi:two-component system response regulator AtoC
MLLAAQHTERRAGERDVAREEADPRRRRRDQPARVLSAQLVRDGYDVHDRDGWRGGARAPQGAPHRPGHHRPQDAQVDGMELLRARCATIRNRPVSCSRPTARSRTPSRRSRRAPSTTSPSPSIRTRSGRSSGRRCARAISRTRTPRATRSRAREGRQGALRHHRREPGDPRRVHAILERVADTPTTVLITGESGTGKELVARALHENSSPQATPVHQGQLRRHPQGPDGERALRLRARRLHGRRQLQARPLRAGDGGTLFLDEIGEIPNEMQVKLLRVLQESEFERVGGIKTIQRRRAPRRRDQPRPQARDRRGAFREDLFYRLNVVPIVLPALRERPERHPAARRALHPEVQRAPQEDRRGRVDPRRWRGSRATAGRATSASWRT